MTDKTATSEFVSSMRGSSWLAPLWPPVLVFLLGGLLWEGAVRFWNIPAILLPAPHQVAEAMWMAAPQLRRAMAFTSVAALTGFVFSLVGGILIATLFSQSRWVRQGFYPYAIFLQTVPIVAIAPLIVIWIGEGFWAIVVIAFIISLFPVVTNATDGLLRAPEDLHELFRLYRANRWETFTRLQFPHALPRILTGAKIASATSVLGAIVGEFFAGADAKQSGLGYLIFTAKNQFRIDLLFAAVFLCTILGVSIFYSVSLLGDRYLLYWYDKEVHS